MSQRTPEATARAIELDRTGATKLWFHEADDMRERLGLVRGMLATAAMAAAMGAAVLTTFSAKQRFDLPRPFELDPRIRPLGPIPKDSSFPSGHAAASAAAADVLAHFDPAHAAHYEQLAHDVAAARVYSGVHLPSDVAAGAAVGHAAAARFT
ncbi:MAG: PA-phosphatase [Thermoleophilia bacterium]|nr:PA-phosphatase [Thermoleophilia bacterium]